MNILEGKLSFGKDSNEALELGSCTYFSRAVVCIDAFMKGISFEESNCRGVSFRLTSSMEYLSSSYMMVLFMIDFSIRI